MKQDERFWDKVDVPADPDNCWEWLSLRSTSGYGRYSIGGRKYPAHRLAYEHFKGAVPAGLQLDHLCRNRLCVNPDHLEPVTQRENILRGVGAAALAMRGELPWNYRGTHQCGHPKTDENTYTRPNGQRCCRICKCRQRREYKQRRRQRAEAS